MSEQLKNKILNMEVPPPAAAWDFIASRLDEQAVSGEALVQRKMNDLEVSPPAQVWSEIEKELDKNAEKVVPIIRNRNSIFLRYAAAAAIVGLVSLYLFRTFNKSDFSAEVQDAQRVATDNESLSNDSSNNQVTDSNSNHSSTETTSNIPTARSNTSSRLPLETKKREQYAYNEPHLKKAGAGERSIAEYNPSEGVRIIASNVSNNVPSGINAVTADNNYFITTGPNGEVVRVSNKLAGIVQSLGDNKSTSENPDQQENVIWKQRLNELRNKLSKLAPSPDNFMDIVQLARALNEEKKP